LPLCCTCIYTPFMLLYFSCYFLCTAALCNPAFALSGPFTSFPAQIFTAPAFCFHLFFTSLYSASLCCYYFLSAPFLLFTAHCLAFLLQIFILSFGFSSIVSCLPFPLSFLFLRYFLRCWNFSFCLPFLCTCHHTHLDFSPATARLPRYLTFHVLHTAWNSLTGLLTARFSFFLHSPARQELDFFISAILRVPLSLLSPMEFLPLSPLSRPGFHSLPLTPALFSLSTLLQIHVFCTCLSGRRGWCTRALFSSPLAGLPFLRFLFLWVLWVSRSCSFLHSSLHTHHCTTTCTFHFLTFTCISCTDFSPHHCKFSSPLFSHLLLDFIFSHLSPTALHLWEDFSGFLLESGLIILRGRALSLLPGMGPVLSFLHFLSHWNFLEISHLPACTHYLSPSPTYCTVLESLLLLSPTLEQLLPTLGSGSHCLFLGLWDFACYTLRYARSLPGLFLTFVFCTWRVLPASFLCTFSSLFYRFCFLFSRFLYAHIRFSGFCCILSIGALGSFSAHYSLDYILSLEVLYMLRSCLLWVPPAFMHVSFSLFILFFLRSRFSLFSLCSTAFVFSALEFFLHNFSPLDLFFSIFSSCHWVTGFSFTILDSFPAPTFSTGSHILDHSLGPGSYLILSSLLGALEFLDYYWILTLDSHHKISLEVSLEGHSLASLEFSPAGRDSHHSHYGCALEGTLGWNMGPAYCTALLYTAFSH